MKRWPREPQIIVTLEGGIVTAVVTHDPALVGMNVAIVDYDSDGADASEITQVKQHDGSYSEAIVGHDRVEQATIELEDAP